MLEIVATYTKKPLVDITPDMVFGKDLIIDSIDMWEMLVKIKTEYPSIDQNLLFKVKTVKDLEILVTKNI